MTVETNEVDCVRSMEVMPTFRTGDESVKLTIVPDVSALDFIISWTRNAWARRSAMLGINKADAQRLRDWLTTWLEKQV